MKMNNKKKGFTLIELIVVIAILGILAAVLIPKFTGFQDKAKSTQALVDAKQIATAIDALSAEGSGASDTASIASMAFGGSMPSGGSYVSGSAPDASGNFVYTVNGFKAGRNASTGNVVKLIP